MAKSPAKSKAPKPGSLAFFHQAVRRDLRDPGFYDHVAAQRFDIGDLPPRTSLKIATIAGAYSNLSLGPNADVLPLTPEGVHLLAEAPMPDPIEVMDEETGEVVEVQPEPEPFEKPDFLLIESAYVYAALEWMVWVGECFAGGTPSATSPLKAVLDLAKAQKIPTVFWFKESVEQVADFYGLAKRCDHVFATSEASVAAFKALDGKLKVGHLPVAIEPAFFNPHRNDPGGFGREQRRYFMCFDKFRELSDGGRDQGLADLLQPALKYNFWIFESRFDMRSNSSRLAVHYRQRFLGCFGDAQRAYLYKMHDVSLQLGTQETPSARDEQHVLEAMACKALVVSNYAEEGTPFAGLTLKITDKAGLDETLEGIAADRGRHRKLTHLAYRHVMQNHTYFERLKTICKTLKIAPKDYDLFGVPRVSIIMPTRRPELVPFALNNFRNQTYPDCELVIVLHGEEFDKSEIEGLLGKDDKNVRVVVVPRRETVSTVLNTGIALSTGAYFARMDDDDYYAPNYFTDAMLARHYVDFDICGKAQWMVYFEGKDGIFLHKGDTAAHSTNKAIAGGTFLVKNTGEIPAFFFDRVQGYADVDYIGRNIVEHDKKLVTTDIFNFVQIRRNDLDSHTWTITQDNFDHGEQICDGFLFEEVAL